MDATRTNRLRYLAEAKPRGKGPPPPPPAPRQRSPLAAAIQLAASRANIDPDDAEAAVDNALASFVYDRDIEEALERAQVVRVEGDDHFGDTYTDPWGDSHTINIDFPSRVLLTGSLVSSHMHEVEAELHKSFSPADISALLLDPAVSGELASRLQEKFDEQTASLKRDRYALIGSRLGTSIEDAVYHEMGTDIDTSDPDGKSTSGPIDYHVRLHPRVVSVQSKGRMIGGVPSLLFTLQAEVKVEDVTFPWDHRWREG